MPTYVVLAHFTDQGIRNIKESPKREEAFREMCEKLGARVKDAYRTMGRYDVVATIDAPNDGVMTTIAYSLGSRGNIRTETLRAFTRQETDQALADDVGISPKHGRCHALHGRRVAPSEREHAAETDFRRPGGERDDSASFQNTQHLRHCHLRPWGEHMPELAEDDIEVPVVEG